MRGALICTVLVATLGGCGVGSGQFLLSEEGIRALQENFEGAVETQHMVGEYIFAMGHGDVDPNIEYTSFEYIAPSVANNWIGSLTVTGGSFPFGNGDLTLTFTAMADGAPVDPATVDMTSFTNVTVDGELLFNGTSLTGETLVADADLVISTVQNASQIVSTLINGVASVNHGGYDVELNPNNLAVTLDVFAHDVTSVTGSVSGEVDIPDFILDADFDVTGLGDSIEIGIDAGATTIDYVVALTDL